MYYTTVMTTNNEDEKYGDPVMDAPFILPTEYDLVQNFRMAVKNTPVTSEDDGGVFTELIVPLLHVETLAWRMNGALPIDQASGPGIRFALDLDAAEGFVKKLTNAIEILREAQMRAALAWAAKEIAEGRDLEL